MALFEYKAANPSGKKISGFIDANSIEEAKFKLRSSGICFLSIMKHHKKSFLKISKQEPKLTGQSLITFTEQLAQLLRAGVPLYESLLSLEEELRQEKYHPILLSLCEQIKGGSLLSKAMSHFPNSFSPLYQAIVTSGESIGAIDQALFKLSRLLSKQRKLKKSLTAALTYPILLGGFSCVILVVLLTFVIPSIETIFAERDVNRFTALVMSVSHLVTKRWPLCIASASALCFFGMLFYKTSACKDFLWKVGLKLPLVKTILIQTALTRFCRTLSSLLGGGVSLVDGLSIARKVMKNPLLEKDVERAKEKVIQGSTLSKELKKSAYIPPLMIRSISIGEESGNTPQMLSSLAELYEEDLERKLAKLTSLAQPIILLVLGGIVGLIMLAVLIPLTDVTGFIGG